MILALDVGNTHIFGGVFEGRDLRVQFRTRTKPGISSDDLGIFLRAVLRENGIQHERIQHLGVCSVVPDLDHSIGNCGVKYFRKEPFFLRAGVKTGLKIKYRNPLEVGADRIANTIAATQLYPNQNMIVVDCGTATTFCVISSDRDYLGGLIFPGLRISMEALEANTSKLPAVELVVPKELVGRSAVESIQSGLYYNHVAAIRYISQKIKKEYFLNKATTILGTGGLGRLLEEEKLFDHFIPELSLQGLRIALELNGYS